MLGELSNVRSYMPSSYRRIFVKEILLKCACARIFAVSWPENNLRLEHHRPKAPALPENRNLEASCRD
jgi:hypothetical protein